MMRRNPALRALKELNELDTAGIVSNQRACVGHSVTKDSRFLCDTTRGEHNPVDLSKHSEILA
jgi:hypothetical protein